MRGTYTKTDNFEVIDTIGVPHPYTITNKHVSFASEHHCGRLGEDAIKAGEKQGITCGVRGCLLSYDEHEQALLIACKAPLRIEGENNPDLIKYLEANARECEDNGYAGFSFIDRRDEG
jgi:hypothetical protein